MTDSSILLEEPKIASYIPEMKQNIAKLLNIEPVQVTIKANTGEKVGVVGNSEAAEAYAVVLINS